MATTEYEQPKDPTHVTIVKAAHDLTGTDARLSLRLLAALVLVGAAGASAPMPVNIVFAAAFVIVCIEVARLAWKR